ncbi:pentatricopeptide repeat-containing protein At3g22150, chloroplastic [Eucalyptus grandis]|nr:pentatricopeptide repeat-containing protein At3g22150, chloroplastic [Eucalyptus grandis]
MMATSALPLSPPFPHSHISAAAATAAPGGEALLSPPKPTLKTPTVRSRLSRLCQEGQPHLARQLFDTITRPSAVLWNTIIIGFICNNMPDEALLFYSRMKRASPDVQSDSYTYSSTLKACAETRNLRVGKAVHCHFIRCQPNPSRIVYNSLLNMYSACLNSAENDVGYLMDSDYSVNDPVRRVFDTMRRRNVVSWNTLVSWYVKTERYMDAVKHFRTMMKTGIRPSPVSFVNIFPAISGVGKRKLANVFYGFLLKSGDEFVNDLFVVSSAVFMYAELGFLDIARKIFDHCVEKNTEVWNTMICAYVQNDCPAEGIELFAQALASEQMDLDDVTFLSVLMAVSQLQRLDLALQLHAYLIKRFTVLPVNILNAVIVMYSRCNSVQTSFKVFDKMLQRDIVSWNTVISAFVQNGLDDEGLMLAYEMQKQGFMADPVTVTALLSTASNLKNQRIGKEVHAYLLRNGIQFEGMGSYLIDMYAKCGLIRTAEQIFNIDYMNARDQAIWNAMISGYTQNELTEEVFVILRRMLEQKVMPNAVTIASVLPACISIGSISFGKQLHGFSVRNFLDQNIFVDTALIDTYSKLGVIRDAENAFRRTPKKNSVTYTTMILGYGQHGMGERAVSLFHSMKGLGIEPDAITFVAVLSACSYAGLVDEGLQIFRLMEREYKIQPSTEHYCCIADMLGRVGRVREAFEFVNELGEDGNKLAIWGSLLGACKIHRHFEIGESVARKMIELGIGNNSSGYQVLLSNLHAEEGNWESVDRLRGEMREKGLRKEVGCSWIDIAGTINYFLSRDQGHDQCDEIYSTLDGLATEMRKAGYRPSLDPDHVEVYE